MGYRWVVLSVGALAQGTNAAVFLGLPAISPQLQQHFSLALPQIGLLLGAVNLGTMIALVPWGVVADRRGERLVMTIGGVGAAACLLSVALGNAWIAGLALLGAGLFGASVNAASGRAVMSWFSRESRGLAMGVRQTATPLGAALTAAVLPGIAISAGIPTAFVVLAGVTAFVALAVALLVREPPGAIRASTEHGLVLKDPKLLRLSLASGLLVVPQFTATALLVPLLHGHRGMSVTAAAAIFAVAQLLGGAGRLAVGVWSDRVRSRIGPLKIVSVLTACGFVLVAALDQAPLPLLIAVLVPTSLFALCWNGLAVTEAGELAPEGRSATAIAMQNSANYLSAAVTPFVASFVAVHVAWPAAMLLAAVAALASVAVLRGQRSLRGVRHS
ncbi:Sugar phosphate permease [Lentzea waywayandensis]|uniref:Sugar phosphate permease n=1 Tax=Lentzea waywayandensis TaxID=84724 RepID=A0A1I6ELI1_9PSEU|nr:MFS transporter [Lentzea waywayandensis]SFR18609.1 Sugar phosphate permease [Lentzea waywayandensis]